MAAAAASVGCCLLLASATGPVSHRFRPAQAVVMLTVSALVLSVACGAALTTIAVAVLATVTSIATEGHWSAAVVHADMPLPSWLGMSATVAVVVLLLRAGWRTARIAIALGRAERLCRTMRAGSGPVVMVDDDTADAFTVAGIHGCVVIGRSLFSHLTTDERQVVTAHELSHLRRRHHLYVHLVDIAAAANPLLRTIPRAVRIGVERWADEDAAAGVGDRRVTGRAVARVALVRSALARSARSGASQALGGLPVGGVSTATVLGVAQYAVADRVQALLQPVHRGRSGVVATVLLLSLLVLLLGVNSLDHLQDVIEGATWHRPLAPR